MTEAMIALAALLAVVGVVLLLVIDVAAFGESAGRGLLSLLLPPYALWFAWRRLHRPFLAVGVLLFFLAAGTAGLFSDAFAPEMEMPTQEGFEGFEDLEAPLND